MTPHSEGSPHTQDDTVIGYSLRLLGVSLGWTLTTLGGAIVLLGSLFSLVSTPHPLLELLCHLLFQGVVLFVLGGLVLLGLEAPWRFEGGLKGWIQQPSARWVWMALAGFIFIVLGRLGPYYWPQKTLTSEETLPHSRLLMVNLNAKSQNPEAVIGLVESRHPDVLVVLECTPFWALQLRSRLLQYPYHQMVAREDVYGLGVYSRYPIKNVEVLKYPEAAVSGNSKKLGGSFEIPILKVEVHPLESTGRRPFQMSQGTFKVTATEALTPYTVVVIHLPPPLYSAHIRHGVMEVLSQWFAQQPPKVLSRTILVGDLNMTPFGPYYGPLMAKGLFRDSLWGQGTIWGIQPSWPAILPHWAGIPIDHIWLGQDFQVKTREVLSPVGSSHRPVWIDVVHRDGAFSRS